MVWLSIAGGVHCTPGADTTPAPEATTDATTEARQPAPPPTMAGAADPPAAQESSEAATADAPQQQPAMRVYRDPLTGRIGPPPRDAEVPESALSERAASTSADGLVEESSPVEGGGTMIDLEGRFRSVVEGRVDDAGNLSTGCGEEPHDEHGADHHDDHGDDHDSDGGEG